MNILWFAILFILIVIAIVQDIRIHSLIKSNTVQDNLLFMKNYQRSELEHMIDIQTLQLKTVGYIVDKKTGSVTKYNPTEEQKEQIIDEFYKLESLQRVKRAKFDKSLEERGIN